MKILVIEDDRSLNKSIVSYLEKKGYVCESVLSYDEAKIKVNLYEYDCILVDIELPGGSGLNIIGELKEIHAGAGILIISALSSLQDKITGLNSGADDYLAKPFHIDELFARINSIIRRREFHGERDIRFKEIYIRPDSKEVYIYDQPVPLTRKEYDLLLYLVTNSGRIIKKELIAEHIRGDDIDQTPSFDFLYNHIKNIRKKIIRAGGNDYIRTVYGVGYRFSDPEDPE